MAELLDLCYDVLIRILEEVNPEDLAACAQTSWAFNHFIKDNKRLYKSHYLRNWDDPRRRPGVLEPQWVPELQKLVTCRKILQSKDKVIKNSNLDFVASSIFGLVNTASEHLGESSNKEELSRAFESSSNLDCFMHKSSLYSRAGTTSQSAASSEDHRQISAKIHCFYGIPSNPAGRRSLSTHPFARSRVYDLRNYTDKTRWGPYRDDGSMKVDWEMIESIMIVLGYNSGLCCRRFMQGFRPPWSEPFEGMIKEKNEMLPVYPTTLPMEPEIPLQMKDPYGVTGMWTRIVCFLDYNDLYQFNFSREAIRIPGDQPREPITTEEALRHIMMRLSVTKVEPAGQGENQDLPVVHFTGSCKALYASWDPNANSKIRGTVSLTSEGEVRWSTVSILWGDEERWRSEGIQVGGPNSKRGVVGTWFDKDYDVHGPAGPTAFWKVCDSTCLEEEDEESESDYSD